jgi:hypothetical protein
MKELLAFYSEEIDVSWAASWNLSQEPVGHDPEKVATGFVSAIRTAELQCE